MIRSESLHNSPFNLSNNKTTIHIVEYEENSDAQHQKSLSTADLDRNFAMCHIVSDECNAMTSSFLCFGN
jgi:hypothetical protein